jgi:AraC-like DNA-binding protein
MRTFEHSPASIDAPGQHAECVYLVAQGETPAPGLKELSASWRRSANAYGVDAAASTAPHILTNRELKEVRSPLDELILSTEGGLDRLYGVVRMAAYAVLFCDTAGVVVAHRGEETKASEFKYWGTWLGGVWSEAIEGTNGIGTCIAEERPVTVHRSQHFRSRHMNLSCSGAPVFDIDGSLMAVLDVSAIDPGLSEGAHTLTGALTVAAARAIEEQFFRGHFLREWVIAVAWPENHDPAVLLAVNASHQIVGANRAARRRLLLDDLALSAGVSLWSIFDRDVTIFQRKQNTDIPARLAIAGSDETCVALVTPPESAFGAWRTAATTGLHTRPRLDLFAYLTQPPPASQERGGLSSGTMRRVREYVESHLSESIELAELAAIAGLSMFHFSRQFKQSTGVTPHTYLVRRRVERSQEMLARTQLPVAAIALAVGFSDQSHLARHFRQMLGTTPREFRRSQH